MTGYALLSHNANVAPLTFRYKSTAADAQPILVTQYELDPAHSVPSSVTAQLEG